MIAGNVVIQHNAYTYFEPIFVSDFKTKSPEKLQNLCSRMFRIKFFRIAEIAMTRVFRPCYHRNDISL